MTYSQDNPNEVQIVEVTLRDDRRVVGTQKPQ